MAAGELTPKQQAFVDEYLVDLNATQAAIRAGYSEKSAGSIGEENLKKPEIAAAVQAALDERAERTGVTADRVLAELAAIAFSDLTDFTAWTEDGELQMTSSAELSPEARAALREIGSTTSTVVFKDGGERSSVYKRVRQHDKLRALELLGRHLGMFKRDLDVQVKVGITLSRLAELAGDDDPGD